MKQLWKNELSRIIVSFLILIGLLSSLAVMPVLTHAFGQEVKISAGAYHPSDVFRGSHIRLFYTIQDIPLERMDASLQAMFTVDDYQQLQQSLRGKNIYVTLKEEGGLFVIEQASLDKPDTTDYIRAQVNYVLYGWHARDPINPESDVQLDDRLVGIHVTYPSDRYYMSQTDTELLLQAMRDQEAIATVRIWRGHMVLKSLHVD